MLIKQITLQHTAKYCTTLPPKYIVLYKIIKTSDIACNAWFSSVGFNCYISRHCMPFYNLFKAHPYEI